MFSFSLTYLDGSSPINVVWIVGLVCAVVALIGLAVVVVVLLLTRQRGKDKGGHDLSCFNYSVNINSFE